MCIGSVPREPARAAMLALRLFGRFGKLIDVVLAPHAPVRLVQAERPDGRGSSHASLPLIAWLGV